MLQRYKHKFGIDIPYWCDIGGGFVISHFGGIFFSDDVKIGKNFKVYNGVTLGRKNDRSPIIMDNVTICPYVILAGNLTILDNSIVFVDDIRIKLKKEQQKFTKIALLE
jgi:serine O-acetyltransferase